MMEVGFRWAATVELERCQTEVDAVKFMDQARSLAKDVVVPSRSTART